MTFRFAALVPLLLAGCTQPAELPEPGLLTRAASPYTAQPAPAGPAVGYRARPITEPGDWRQLNDAQAPGGSS
jgi:hypothetical protein